MERLIKHIKELWGTVRALASSFWRLVFCQVTYTWKVTIQVIIKSSPSESYSQQCSGHSRKCIQLSRYKSRSWQ